MYTHQDLKNNKMTNEELEKNLSDLQQTVIDLAKAMNHLVLEVKAIKEWIDSTQIVDEMDPETFYNIEHDIRFEADNTNVPLSEKEQVHQKLLKLEASLQQAVENEEFEICGHLQQVIDELRRKFTNL